MNRYPLWKYLLIAVVVVLGALYAAPNLYSDDPAVQIAGSRKAVVTDETLKQVEATLRENKLDYKSAALDPTGILIRFRTEQDQHVAKEQLSTMLGEDYVVALNFAATTPDWLRAINAAPMYLGLDLRGGLHFLIEINMATAYEQELERFKNEFFDHFRKNRDKDIRARATLVKDDGIELKYADANQRTAARNSLRNTFPEFEFSEFERGDSFYIKASLTRQKIEEHRANTIAQIITVLKKRIDDKYQGLMEPVIVRQGDNRIVAEFPGVQNSEELMDILTATASLEFRMQQDKYSVQDAQAGRAPGSKLYVMRETGEPVLLKNKIIITGKEVTHATATSDENGLPAVSVTLDGTGARIMGDNTKENLGKRMGVVFIEYELSLIHI